MTISISISYKDEFSRELNGYSGIDFNKYCEENELDIFWNGGDLFVVRDVENGINGLIDKSRVGLPNAKHRINKIECSFYNIEDEEVFLDYHGSGYFVERLSDALSGFKESCQK